MMGVMASILFLLAAALPGWTQTLPGTAPLVFEGDPAAAMVDGIHRFLDGYRAPQGKADRQRLALILGVVEARTSGRLELLGQQPLAASAAYTVWPVRWPALVRLDGEGLLLRPKKPPAARVIALGDADWTPEMMAGLAPAPAVAPFARRLAECGIEVLIPLLMDRRATYSGLPQVRMTNQPHREFLWRIGFPLGRHPSGLEVQKILAAVDGWAASPGPIGVAGYGEGGMLALFAAALDARIQAALVSGAFGPRDQLWQEPIYRSVWGLLPDYGDAALAGLIQPRQLVVEAAPGPRVDGPPPPTAERRGAAPGRLTPFSYDAVAQEVGRVPGQKPALVAAAEPGSPEALKAFLHGLGVSAIRLVRPHPVTLLRAVENAEERFKRQFRQFLDYFDRLAHDAAKVRQSKWRFDAASPARWAASVAPMRELLWEDVIGRLPEPSVPAHPRARRIIDTMAVSGWEVMLDVWPNVFAFGILLVPKNLRPGERRPAVVCQHGLEGRPRDVADPAVTNKTYNQFAVRLAEAGFVTFAPQNPYIGGDRFRQVQRKAHPWRLSLFSFVAGQHQRILEWLRALDFVDPERIGFYGLSYGGYTAMRIPALLDGYRVVVCSGNFNEWVWKTATLDAPFVYPLTGEYEIGEWDFAHRFNHAELAVLIFPRPFFVERGHADGVSWDEWVAYEYAKVRRFYAQMGLADRTAIEYFNGGHVIHLKGALEFLKKHLGPLP